MPTICLTTLASTPLGCQQQTRFRQFKLSAYKNCLLIGRATCDFGVMHAGRGARRVKGPRWARTVTGPPVDGRGNMVSTAGSVARRRRGSAVLDVDNSILEAETRTRFSVF